MNHPREADSSLIYTPSGGGGIAATMKTSFAELQSARLALKVWTPPYECGSTEGPAEACGDRFMWRTYNSQATFPIRRILTGTRDSDREDTPNAGRVLFDWI